MKLASHDRWWSLASAQVVSVEGGAAAAIVATEEVVTARVEVVAWVAVVRACGCSRCNHSRICRRRDMPLLNDGRGTRHRPSPGIGCSTR